MATLVSGASLKLPSLPSVPQVYDASRGGAAVPTLTDPSTAPTKAFVQQQIAALPATYEASKQGAAANAMQGLAGYGGYSVDASGNLNYDASQVGSGQQERQAVQGQRSAANSTGTLYSSFTDTGIANALGRLSQTAQGVVNQYADQLAGYLGQASTNFTNLYGQWAGALGQDASFAMQNPPPGVAAPAPVTPDQSLSTAMTMPATSANAPTALGKAPVTPSVRKPATTLTTRFGVSPFRRWSF
jgi:hypothetical protein